ncbi:hypothetical protein [Mammaliicoccus sciuri]|uniref:hypothetical protein n=1 Tax=Mammaliicoccus sciuri TaxID=1296 RepID=UPI001D162F66|nr:hypothetical protein [Mammaliicoccus sciuri]
MKKVLILVLTLILFVAACGNNNDNKDSSSKKDSSSDTKSFTMDNGKKVDVPKTLNELQYYTQHMSAH